MEYFKFKEEFFDFAKLQVTQINKEDLSFYDKLSLSEYRAIKKYLPKAPKNVLDLGCGLGRMAIFLNMKYNDDNIHYILADGNCDKAEKPQYGWNPQSNFYNNLSLTKDFSEYNGLKNYEILDLSNDTLDKLKNIDVIMSFLSVGFHYPIKPYLESLMKISSSDCIFIFGARKKVYKGKEFNKYMKLIGKGLNTVKVHEELLIFKKK